MSANKLYAFQVTLSEKKISKEKEIKRRNAKEILSLFPFSILVIAFSAECLIFLV